MTSPPSQLVARSLRAPQENRTALVDPPFPGVADLVRRNVELRGKYSYDFHGRSLADLRELARRELVRDAQRWTSAYREIGSAGREESSGTADTAVAQGTAGAAVAQGTAGLIYLAGHQPQIFHPGVWLKNFALGSLARQHGALAVNLVIDSDTVQSTALRVPGETSANPRIEMLPFDRPAPLVPYEERPILDRELFASFGSRVAERMQRLVRSALIDVYWPLAIRRSHQTSSLGACLAQARHQLEGQWGLATLEVPQSWVCSAESFSWLVAHLLAELPRFRHVYNEAVREYRRVYRVRSSAHPFPDLAADGPWLEAPLWVWTAENPRRRRLFACRRGDEIVLADRDAWQTSLPLKPDGDAAAAVERLLQLARQGVRIRSRALVTTLWARLMLGDLFMHGIGGAKYDQVTDLLIERFIGLAPPGFMVLSATLHLPIERGWAATDGRAIDHRLRELTHHPEHYINSPRTTAGGADDPGELIAAKARWIRTPETRENARARCRAIRQLNARLQLFVAAQRAELLARQAQTLQAVQAEAILRARDYGFCLYPEENLREFFAALLPNPA